MKWKKQGKKVFEFSKKEKNELDDRFGEDVDERGVKGSKVENGVRKELVEFVEDRLREVEGRNLKY
jgi:hypothetical protein